MEIELIGRLGTATSKAVLRFKELEIDQTVTVEEMTTLLALDCGPEGAGRPAMRKAIAHVLAHDKINIAWDSKDKVWRRTNNSDTARQTYSDIMRARRCTKRGLQRVACVKPSQLNEEERAEFRVSATQLALAHIGLSDDTRENIPQGDTMVDTQRLLLSIRPVG
mgnify:CR=1 FL=1